MSRDARANANIYYHTHIPLLGGALNFITCFMSSPATYHNEACLSVLFGVSGTLSCVCVLLIRLPPQRLPYTPTHRPFHCRKHTADTPFAPVSPSASLLVGKNRTRTRSNRVMRACRIFEPASSTLCAGFRAQM